MTEPTDPIVQDVRTQRRKILESFRWNIEDAMRHAIEKQKQAKNVIAPATCKNLRFAEDPLPYGKK